MRLQNLRIGVRLAIGFSVVLALLTLMSSIGLARLASIDESTDRLVAELLQKERLASEWLLATNGNAIRAEAVARSSNAAETEYFQKTMDGKSASISAIQKKLEGLVASDEEKKLFEAVAARRKTYIDMRKAILKLKSEGATDVVARIDSEMMPALQAYVASIEAVLGFYRNEINAAHDSITADYKFGRNVIIVGAAVALMLGAFLAWFLTVGITRPLNRAVNLAQQVAEGDLTADAGQAAANGSADETGQLLGALKAMQDRLAQTIVDIRQGAETIAHASSEIADGNLDLSSRTEEQAGALGQTASSMDQLTNTVRQSADNARQANAMAVSAAEVAARGGDIVADVQRTMEKITESSRQMNDIISVIDGIAFQTNILALNASVEAARAGEQGRGFAVVAAEVRNLAQRSAVAAKEIKELINASDSNIQAGSRLVAETGSTMEEIVQSVRQVTDIMAEISAATQEQSAGIEHVNQAIGQMDAVTQQNAALVEEAAAAADALKDQAAALERAVSVFRLDARLQSTSTVNRLINVAPANEPRRLTQA